MATVSRVLSRTLPLRVAAPARHGNGGRVNPHLRQSIRRFASESSQSTGSPGGYGAVAGGLAGGAAALLVGYTWYRFSGAKSALDRARTATKYMEAAKDKMAKSAPESGQALQWLRQTAQSYAVLIPGGKAYVDAALSDLDTLQEKHSGELDAIVSETYDKIKQITTSEGLTQDSAYKCFKAVEDALEKIGRLASDSGKEILENHPQLKQYVGEDFEELKRIGERWGPEAKEQVDKTWEQIQSTLSQGVGAESIEKVRQIINEKKDMLGKIRSDIFEQGLEKAKPYLDKSPQAKELIEQNKDALKYGDLGTLWKKVQDAASSGNIENLEEFIKSSIDDVKKGTASGGGIGDIAGYLKLLPGAEEVTDKLQRLEDVRQKYGKEAENLLKSTVDDLKQVLSKRVEEAEALGQKASNER